MLQLRAKTKSLTCPPLSITRYSFIQRSELLNHIFNPWRYKLSLSPFWLVAFRCFGSICRRYDRGCHLTCGRWRSIDRPWPALPLVHSTDTCTRPGLCDSFWVFFEYKKLPGRIQTRICDRMDCQSIRTACDISRDDRARIATCILLTSTDRLKMNYSIDTCSWNIFSYDM